MSGRNREIKRKRDPNFIYEEEDPKESSRRRKATSRYFTDKYKIQS